MTDNDDWPPHRDPPPSRARREGEAREQDSPGRGHVARLMRIAETREHGGPTDPAVPRAKRQGALRRQRSLVGLTAVIMGLLTITLSLLYRASQNVGERGDSDDEMSAEEPRADTARSPLAPIQEGTKAQLSPPAPREPGAALGVDVLGVEVTSTDSGAAAASALPHPVTSPPALDIIRSPAF